MPREVEGCSSWDRMGTRKSGALRWSRVWHAWRGGVGAAVAAAVAAVGGAVAAAAPSDCCAVVVVVDGAAAVGGAVAAVGGVGSGVQRLDVVVAAVACCALGFPSVADSAAPCFGRMGLAACAAGGQCWPAAAAELEVRGRPRPPRQPRRRP